MNRKKKNILITNDDGILAPGIRHLAAALCSDYTITVVAPAQEKSGSGASITVSDSLHVRKVDFPVPVAAWSVTGTPADCTRLGVIAILDTPPDLIVSGINRGSNHGRTVLYSGTIGGVIEGVFRGIPGIAFSSYNYYMPEYAVFEPYIPRIVDYVCQHPMPSGTLLNVTFPDTTGLKDGKISGVKMTSQGRQYWREDRDRLPEQRGEGEYIIDSKISNCSENEHSDSYWLQKGWITAVPVHVDELTDWRYMKNQKEHFDYIHQ